MEEHDHSKAPEPEPVAWDDGPIDEFDELEPQSPFDRFAEVFYAPDLAFEGLAGVRNRGAVIAWGLVIAVIVAIGSTYLTYANPAVRESIHQKQVDAIEQRYESGKMTKEQHDKALEMMNGSHAGTFALVGAIGAGVMIVIVSLLAALIAFLVAKVLESDHGTVSYSTALAAYLISSMIAYVGMLIKGVGVYLTGSVDFPIDLSSVISTHSTLLKMMLTIVGPFTIWALVVMGIGLAVITGASRGRAVGVWVGTWVVLMAIIGGIIDLLGSAFGMAG